MKSSKINWDLTNEKELGDAMFSVVPSGDYNVSLAYSQFKDTPGKVQLEIGYMIEDGQHKGKMIKDRLVKESSNDRESSYGKSKAKTILLLQNRKSFKMEKDTDFINSTVFCIEVEVRPYVGNDGKEYNGNNVGKLKPCSNFKSELKEEPKAASKKQEQSSSSDEETPPWLR